MKIIAEYTGLCSKCDEPIEPGDAITVDDEDEWAHAKCPDRPSRRPTKFQGKTLEAMGF